MNTVIVSVSILYWLYYEHSNSFSEYSLLTTLCIMNTVIFAVSILHDYILTYLYNINTDAFKENIQGKS